MGIKEKIKSLFKKKVIEPNKTVSLNGLYSAKSSDVKELAQQVNHIQDTLDNLNIPVIPDHSDFATKSTDNIFTGTNTFTKAIKCETFPEISKGNYEPTANRQLAPKYYVDKKVNENIAGLDNKVQMLHNQQQDGINHLNDITAKKTEPNTFTGLQTFNNISATNISTDNIVITQQALFNGNITNNNQLVTKEYVDSKTTANQAPVFATGSGVTLDWRKTHLMNGLYKYSTAFRGSINIGSTVNRSYIATIIIGEISTISSVTNGITAPLPLTFSLNVPAGTSSISLINVPTIDCFSGYDFKPGSSGDFRAVTYYKLIMVPGN